MIIRRASVLLLFLFVSVTSQAQQIVDPEYKAVVAEPAFTKSFPRVLFDEGHNNSLTRQGRYKPFADLIVLDGYQVVSGRKIFSKEMLDTFKILIVANPLGAEEFDDPGADQPAFVDNECDAVRDWVKTGGSLLLIADHGAFGSAAEILAKRFGVEMSKAATHDPGNQDQDALAPGWMMFSRENKLLLDHAVTAGRSDSEKVNRVFTFGGQSLKGPEGSWTFLKLGETATESVPPANDKEISVAGRAQGLALKFGKGRVVVLGDPGMLSAQVIGRERTPMGINAPGTDNKQLALNIMHWLSGLLKER
ncbi:MAG TPA: hypothetical protein VN643_08320 [Pyrinomonadaceae bacterium]|nr:hypothetical protein [Pyrinomonadaceae bacterium]